jgi:hypothetical protein
MEVDGLAIKLLDLVQAELQAQVAKLSLPLGVNVSAAGRMYAQPNINIGDDRYRRVTSPSTGDFIMGSLYSQSPNVSVELYLVALAAKSNSGPNVCAVRILGTGRMLEARQDEMVPQPSAALQFKARSWVERTLAETLSDFGTKAEQQLKA